MRLLLMVAIMLTATPNTEAPVEKALQRVWRCAPGAQSAAVGSTAPELMLSGFKFGRKSNSLGAKACLYASRYGPNRKNPKSGGAYPASRVILCREERAAMEETIVYTVRMEILGPELFDALYKGPPSDALTFPNGSRLMFRGLDQPRRIQGMRYGFAGVDQCEELSEDQYETLNAGCTQAGMPWTQTFGAFNPEGPLHWAYLRFRPDDGDGRRYRTADNTTVTDAALGEYFADVVHTIPGETNHILGEASRARLDRMTGIMRDRMVLGRWVAFTGLVLDNWNQALHVIAAPESWAAWGGYPPPSWRRYRGIDFGFVHPWCTAWIAESPIGYRYLYRQDLRARLTIEEQCARIKRAEAVELETLRACAREMDRDQIGGEYAHLETLNLAGSYSDHEAGHRAQYDALGVQTDLARKDVHGGIETMRSLLEPSQTGGPRLFVVAGSLVERCPVLAEARHPTSFEEQVAGWVWKTAKSATGAKVTKDMPVDEKEDAIMAVTYPMHTVETQGGVGVWV